MTTAARSRCWSPSCWPVGILSGLLAIVVDLGRVYAERRVVQNAADAGALAMAEYCAEGDARCVGDEGATWLNDLAGANSPDAASAVTEVCGTGALGTCTPTTATWKDCQPVAEGYANYARVRTSTKTASGDLFFPAIFAGMMDESGSNELAVAACAQAAWGPAGWATVPLPFLLPICPGYPGDGPIVIEDFDPNDPNQTCTLNGVTYDLITKGMAFADYDGPKKDCTTPVKVGLSPPDIPVETSLEQLCGKDLEPVLKEIIEAGQPVILPVIGGHPKAGQGRVRVPGHLLQELHPARLQPEEQERRDRASGAGLSQGMEQHGLRQEREALVPVRQRRRRCHPW